MDYYTELTVKRSISVISKLLGVVMVATILIGWALIALTHQLEFIQFFQLLYEAYTLVDIGRIEEIMAIYDSNGLEYKSVFLASSYGMIVIFFVVFILMSWPIIRKHAVIILHACITDPNKNTKGQCYIWIFLFLGLLFLLLMDSYYFDLSIESFERKNDMGRYLRTGSSYPFIQSMIIRTGLFFLAVPAVLSVFALRKLHTRRD